MSLERLPPPDEPPDSTRFPDATPTQFPTSIRDPLTAPYRDLDPNTDGVFEEAVVAASIATMGLHEDDAAKIGAEAMSIFAAPDHFALAQAKAAVIRALAASINAGMLMRDASRAKKPTERLALYREARAQSVQVRIEARFFFEMLHQRANVLGLTDAKSRVKNVSKIVPKEGLTAEHLNGFLGEAIRAFRRQNRHLPAAPGG